MDATAVDSRIVAPGTTRLTLSRGDWLLVKQRLNAGETLDLFERAAPGIDVTAPGVLQRLPPSKVGMAIILAYLLDWSLVDPQGTPIPIRGATPEEIEAALRLLDFDSFIEVMNTITAHDAAMRQEKKRSTDARASSATLPSLASVAGGTNG
jgi:hypothetical protein